MAFTLTCVNNLCPRAFLINTREQYLYTIYIVKQETQLGHYESFIIIMLLHREFDTQTIAVVCYYFSGNLCPI